jgi:hydroxylamine reductase (hybrid-cluster protein)
MMRVRKKALDKATESAISAAAVAGIPLPFDRYEDQVPACSFGRMGLDCKACTQGPCRINPFEPSNGTTCGRDRENTVAANFLRLVADGAAANASFAGAQGEAAGVIFDGLNAATEGSCSVEQMFQKAVDAANAGFRALGKVGANGAAPRQIEAGVGAIKPDMVNILVLGGLSAERAKQVAAELQSDGKVNVVAASGGETAGVNVAGNYNSQEALLVTTAVDGVVTGKLCVAPGTLALAASQGIPVMDAETLDATALLDAADRHYRMNAGRSVAARFPAARATVGFSAGTFAGVSPEAWKELRSHGVKGVALMGGCNNAVDTQDGVILRQAREFLANDVLVVASGCAAVALEKAGLADPAKMEDFAGKGLRAFLSALSEAAGVGAPAVLVAGSCWEIPAALELAQLFQRELGVPAAASMPELSRPAGWSSALAIAAQGVPTYVGPILPLDGGLQTVAKLNELLGASGGSLVGPGQAGDPEAFVKSVMDNAAVASGLVPDVRRPQGATLPA